MNKLALKEYELMTKALREISRTVENSLQQAERSYHAVELSLQRLKEQVLNYTFKDKEEEIQFFKETKPRFLKELIYFAELYYIEAGRPVSSRDDLCLYFKYVMESIRLFMERNQAFYNYCRTGKTHSDESYFLRGVQDVPLPPEYSLDMDLRFSTIHSIKLSRLYAYEMLNEYLLAQIDAISNPVPATANRQPVRKQQTDTTWTDPKVDLIELAYAIYARGSVNHGKAEVRHLISALEYTFNIELGNYYAVFQQNIRLRKKNRTNCLDQLKEYLERRMDDLDD